MENNNTNNNNHSPPPPSFAAQLFGDSDSQQPSAAGIFSSIFPPPSPLMGSAQKESSQSQVWTATHGASAENVVKNSASANSSVMNVEKRSIFQERVVPSPLSSSLYYGGQEDMYVCSSSGPVSQPYSKLMGSAQKESSQSQVWTATHGTSAENVVKNSASVNSGVMSMERRSIFQERVVPTPLSSSLYYGGQEDMYVCSSSGPVTQPYSKYKKVDGKDDPNHLHSASRGNWWEGSLYY
ncbi:uncharacterized protein LOC143633272 [Bidens hawaiensis]|uniref:uncharacterized protein LOC143633272 n=1 Tax=Bidens hawaiensis TaxID=980011 RepID=UPI00404A90A5